MLKSKLSLLFLVFFFSAPLCASSPPPLSETQLKKMLVGNTLMGRFSDTGNRYALFYDQSGVVYIQKQDDRNFTYYGKWRIENGLLVTPWPYKDLEVNQKDKMNFYTSRDLTTYKLQFYPIKSEIYEPYKPKTCSCDASPPQAFPHCKWYKGRKKL